MFMYVLTNESTPVTNYINGHFVSYILSILPTFRRGGRLMCVLFSNLDMFTMPFKISYINTVELHLSGLIGMMSHPDMQKIWIIGFLFENRLQWQFEVQKNFYKWLF